MVHSLTCSRLRLSLPATMYSTMSCISCAVGVGILGDGRALQTHTHSTHRPLVIIRGGLALYSPNLLRQLLHPGCKTRNITSSEYCCDKIPKCSLQNPGIEDIFLRSDPQLKLYFFLTGGTVELSECPTGFLVSILSLVYDFLHILSSHASS